jgi:hypothetical protein
MTADQTLLAFVFLFWLFLVVTVKGSNLVGGKRWSDGPSFIPLIPVLPLLAIFVGWVINHFAPFWGTGVVVLAHTGWLGVTLVMMWHLHADGRRKANEKSIQQSGGEGLG